MHTVSPLSISTLPDGVCWNGIPGALLPIWLWCSGLLTGTEAYLVKSLAVRSGTGFKEALLETSTVKESKCTRWINPTKSVTWNTQGVCLNRESSGAAAATGKWCRKRKCERTEGEVGAQMQLCWWYPAKEWITPVPVSSKSGPLLEVRLKHTVVCLDLCALWRERPLWLGWALRKAQSMPRNLSLV